MISNKAVRKHYQKYPWNKTYQVIKDRCENPNNTSFKYYGGKGILCLITREELEILWNRDKAWLLKRPSIDRKNSNRHYTFDNCQFIELSENSCKESKIPIFQFHLNGDFIKRWDSARQAERKLKISNSNINKCLSGKRKSAGGYLWSVVM